MVVITDRRLIERRAEALRKRRGAASATARAEGAMPEWAVEALVELGMTRAEIGAAAPGDRGAPTVPAEPVRTADAIATLEAELVARRDASPAALHALAELALARLKRGGHGQDGGDARAVVLFEHVVGGLARLRDGGWRRTG
jgi:hypothetical protein